MEAKLTPENATSPAPSESCRRVSGRPLVSRSRIEDPRGPGTAARRLERALGNGVSKDEIGELITHLAFYAGRPLR